MTQHDAALAAALEFPLAAPAYAVFTGMGAVGASALGTVIHKDPLSAGRALALALIVGGIVLARVTNPE
ncbi:SMR family transporter [Nocardia uniformis]|uniref:SMR family transporter n=1 Tax=Nocardia uniformis TaxID=53432 RepID=UPI000A00C846|nr:SMR family transporter [Nocardia uniformis]